MGPTTNAPELTEASRARKLARLSWWMLPVFAVWMIVNMFLAGPLAELLGVATGDMGYIEAWVPWIAFTLLLLAPVVAGLVLAVLAAVKGAGKLAWWAIAVHGALVLFFTVPNVIDRIATL